MLDTKESFGNRLRTARNAKRLTQSELAEKVGIAREQLSRYENDVHIPSVAILEWFCVVLDMSATELLGF